MSAAELLLAVQLEQAGIPFDRELAFAKPRRYRADFAVYMPGDPHIEITPLLVEVEGGVWVDGRHVRGEGFESGCEKQALAMLRGHRYLRVTSAQVEDGTALQWIRALLRQKVAVR